MSDKTIATEADFSAETIAGIKRVLAEAKAYNDDMEQRGYHSSNLPEIEGVYDSRTYLLALAVEHLLPVLERAIESEQRTAYAGTRWTLGYVINGHTDGALE